MWYFIAVVQRSKAVESESGSEESGDTSDYSYVADEKNDGEEDEKLRGKGRKVRAHATHDILLITMIVNPL